MRLFFAVFILFFLSLTSGYSQSYKTLKSEGKRFFEDGYYALAVDRFEDCFRKRPTDKQVNFQLGVSYLMLNKMKDAEIILDVVYKNYRKQIPEIAYYLGFLHQRKLEFRKAAKYYKEYLKDVSSGKYAEMVKVRLRNCENGILLKQQPALAAIEFFGEPINSFEDDFHPVLSPNQQESRFYFSSNRVGAVGGLRDKKGKVDVDHGRRNADMFVGDFQPVLSVTKMSGLYNTSLYDEVIGFSPDGQYMFFKKGYGKESGLLYKDYFGSTSRDRISGSLVDVPIDMAGGDATPFFFTDTLIIFASRQLDGYGGLDLFFVSKNADGWQKPINMGPEINSQYDEHCPFLTNNKRGLYFSSNRPAGMGGDDIYKAIYNPVKRHWDKALNMGIPINSADDDQFFQMMADGWHFVFSSNRHDAMGGHDIFEGQFFEQQADQVVMIMDAEQEEEMDTTALTAKVILFQRYTLGTIIPDSTSFVQLKAMTDLLKKYPAARLSLKVTRTSNQLGGFMERLDPLSSVLISTVNSSVPNAAISMRRRLLPPAHTNKPGAYVEAILLNKFSAKERLMPINEVNKYQFIPRTPKGMRYKIEVDEKSSGLEDFLVSYKYDFSFDYWSKDPENQHILFGSFLTYETAKQWAEQLENNSIQIKKIIPFISGVAIDPNSDPTLLATHPQLKDYIIATQKNSR